MSRGETTPAPSATSEPIGVYRDWLGLSLSLFRVAVYVWFGLAGLAFWLFGLDSRFDVLGLMWTVAWVNALIIAPWYLDLRRYPHTAFWVRVRPDGLAVRLYTGRRLFVRWDQVVGLYNPDPYTGPFSTEVTFLNLRDHALSNLGITQIARQAELLEEIRSHTDLPLIEERPRLRGRLFGLYLT